MEKMQSGSFDTAPEMQRRPMAADGVAITVQSAVNITTDKKLASLQELLQADLFAADMKWSLFVASSQSYRCDSCLKPFPPQFVHNGVKDIDGLREVISETPELTKVMSHHYKSMHNPLDSKVIDLLFWVLIQVKEFKLRSLPKKEFGAILAQASSKSSLQPPNHIFEVTSDPHSARLSKWLELAQSRKLWFGFHGSRLENFYSILCHGLQQHMTKRDMFGPGIYLSEELSVSLLYSPTGCASCHNLVGEHMSCVVLCQIIDHPDVKCQTKKDSDTSRSRAVKSRSVEEIPEKYYVVQNSDVVRVQYILVYSNNSPNRRQEASTLVGWVRKHKMFTVIIAYVVMLISVGLTNSPVALKYARMLLKKIGR